MNTPEHKVFVADRHGRADLQCAVRRQFGEDVLYVFVGDHVDGLSDEAHLLKDMQEMYDPKRPNAVLGNHDYDRIQAVLAAQAIDKGQATDETQSYVDMWTRSRRYGQLALQAYNVSPHKYRDAVSQVMALYERMQQAGGLFDFLCDMPLYYEDDKHIAIHAGLTSEPWEQQRRRLDEVKQLMVAGELGLDPPQLYSHALGHQSDAFTATDKIVISGHSPIDNDVQERISGDGRRVRLDRKIWDASGKIFVYHGGERAVMPVYAHKTQEEVA